MFLSCQTRKINPAKISAFTVTWIHILKHIQLTADYSLFLLLLRGSSSQGKSAAAPVGRFWSLPHLNISPPLLVTSRWPLTSLPSDPDLCTRSDGLDPGLGPASLGLEPWGRLVAEEEGLPLGGLCISLLPGSLPSFSNLDLEVLVSADFMSNLLKWKKRIKNKITIHL